MVLNFNGVIVEEFSRIARCIKGELIPKREPLKETRLSAVSVVEDEQEPHPPIPNFNVVVEVNDSKLNPEDISFIKRELQECLLENQQWH